MYLRQVRIENFRNLVDFCVDLSPGVNVIVGENNVGKTNLLDALRAALGPASSGGDLVRLSKDDISREVRSKNPAGAIKVHLLFDGLSEDEQAHFIEILDYDASHPEASTASIHFEWSWSDKTHRWHSRRWAGERANSEAAVPDDILQSLPITMLGALRDALSGLLPGRANRLGRLLDALADDEDRKTLPAIFEGANKQIQESGLVNRVESRIARVLAGAVGSHLRQDPKVRASEPDFERIVHNLRLVLQSRWPQLSDDGAYIEELRSNGLGYNNLLYIAAVLSELETHPAARLPLLLIEEPEAHLHPQLQIVLADYLSDESGKQDAANGSKTSNDGEAPGFGEDAAAVSPGPTEDRAKRRSSVQTLLTSHSPTIAARVPVAALRVMHRTRTGQVRVVPLHTCGLDEKEQRQLRRMLDVTRATLFFARGLLLVEGVSEALLVPVLARRLNISLEDRGISVIPVCGVDFLTLAKLFGPGRIEISVSVITDGDPPTCGMEWKTAVPRRTNGAYEVSARLTNLRAAVESNHFVRVFNSSVTFEFDLADAGPGNPSVMCDIWESCFEGLPRTFNARLLQECAGAHEDEVLAAWRGICLANAAVGKAEFAQRLAERLDAKTASGEYVISPSSFRVPGYLEQAFCHVNAGAAA